MEYPLKSNVFVYFGPILDKKYFLQRFKVSSYNWVLTSATFLIIAARLRTGYMLNSSTMQNGSSSLPIMQLLPIPRIKRNYAPTVSEEVVIVKSRPKALNRSVIPNGCIVDSDDDDELPPITTLSSELLIYILHFIYILCNFH